MRTRRTERSLALAAALLALAGEARAQSPSASEELAWMRQRLVELQARVEQLEAREEDALRAAMPAPAPLSPQERNPVRIGANATLTWFNGEEDTPFREQGFDVWDARFFLDAELSREARLGERTLFRHASLGFEWSLARLADIDNTVGELYVDLRELGGRPLLNAQIGRFQVPVGEAYKRYSRGVQDNPFITNPVAGPWWWDEGIKLFGQDADGRYGYVAALTDGEGFVNGNGDADLQTSLKLFTRPLHWLELSASALRSGEIGKLGGEEFGALWIGETWAIPLGDMTGVPNFQNGAPIADAPEEFSGSMLLGGDAIAQLGPHARLWLSAGTFQLDAEQDSTYDRRLRYWLAELLLSGALASPALDPFYLALRANGLGTYDRDEGYSLDARYLDTLGFNSRSLEAYSIAAGWRLSETLTLRLEYTLLDPDLVRGVTPEIRSAADRSGFFGAALGVDF
jgi:hypothetical protein